MKKKNAILYDVYPTPTPDEDHEQLFYPRAVWSAIPASTRRSLWG